VNSDLAEFFESVNESLTTLVAIVGVVAGFVGMILAIIWSIDHSPRLTIFGLIAIVIFLWVGSYVMKNKLYAKRRQEQEDWIAANNAKYAVPEADLVAHKQLLNEETK